MNAEQRAEFYRTYDPEAAENAVEEALAEMHSTAAVMIEKTLERMDAQYFMDVALIGMQSTGKLIPPERIRRNIAAHIRTIQEEIEAADMTFCAETLSLVLELRAKDMGDGMRNLLRRVMLMAVRMNVEDCLGTDPTMLRTRLGDAEYVRFQVRRAAELLFASDPGALEREEDLLQKTFWDQNG